MFDLLTNEHDKVYPLCEIDNHKTKLKYFQPIHFLLGCLCFLSGLHLLRSALALVALLEFIVQYGWLIFCTDFDLGKLFLSKTIYTNLT